MSSSSDLAAAAAAPDVLSRSSSVSSSSLAAAAAASPAPALLDLAGFAAGSSGARPYVRCHRLASFQSRMKRSLTEGVIMNGALRFELSMPVVTTCRAAESRCRLMRCWWSMMGSFHVERLPTLPTRKPWLVSFFTSISFFGPSENLFFSASMSPLGSSASSSDSENGERLRGLSFFSLGARAFLPLPLPLRSISLASLASLSLSSLPLLCRAFFALLDGAAWYSSSSLPFAELGAMLASLSLRSLPASAGAAASAWLLAAGAPPSPEISPSSESPSAALVAAWLRTGEGFAARTRSLAFFSFFGFFAVGGLCVCDGLGADAFSWAAFFRRLLRAPDGATSSSDTTRSSRSSSTGAATVTFF
mmetsp:Transcript_41174/g.98857  ORF Transcript_41174/g.98857 Transcript_41174/m.98857 type:complete len:362 (+) Transcript_41174:475-1560(+)